LEKLFITATEDIEHRIRAKDNHVCGKQNWKKTQTTLNKWRPKKSCSKKEVRSERGEWDFSFQYGRTVQMSALTGG